MISTFFGNDSETWYRSETGAWWLVQSPDMNPGMVGVSSEGPSEDAHELSWSVCGDFHALAEGLDARRVRGVVTADCLAVSGPETELLTRAEVRERFGAGALAWLKQAAKGEAEQLWGAECTLTAL